MVIASSNRVIDQKDVIGTYEFTVIIRSLFAPDGTVLVCSDKLKIINSLKDLVAGQEEANPLPAMNRGQSRKIYVVEWLNGMVIVQKQNIKAASVNTVKDLSVCFNAKLMAFARDFDEVIVFFDTHKADSLKRKTRQRRQTEKASVRFQVKNETEIRHLTRESFSSTTKQKQIWLNILQQKFGVQQGFTKAVHYLGSR